MVSRHPPVPPANRSPKHKAGTETTQDDGGSAPERENLKEQGRQGNIYQNTRNQGYQQDR